MSTRAIARWIGGVGVLGLGLAFSPFWWRTELRLGPREELARQILAATGVKGGLIVHLGCGNGRLTAALRANESYLVHALDAKAQNVRAAREYLHSLGLYGPVSVEVLRGKHLPYSDNLVNLLVAENLGAIPMDEVMRVLAPNGVAYVKRGDKWTKTVKPWPQDIDEWTHALYDASNNAVANDSVVGPPHHIQWVAGPRNTRHHEHLASISVVVSAGGRIFYIIDEAPTASILLRPKWSLLARDAFNGVLLWKRRIPSWESHLRGFRSGPPELSRRLVAVEDRVYATLGLGAPVTALEAATGKTLKTYKGTEGTEEILYQEGVLFLVLSKSPAGKASTSAPRQRCIMAVEAKTGDIRWERSEPQLLPLALAVGGGRVFFQNSEAVICLEAKTGRQLWRYDRAAAVKRPPWSAPTLLVYDNLLLCADRYADLAPPKKPRWNAAFSAGGPGELVVLSAETGQKLWATKCTETFHAPVDVFVADGLVWVGQSPLRRDADFTLGREPLTGEIKRRLSTEQAFRTTMPHHRCHRNRATSRYIITGRTGVEFINLKTGSALRHHWIRGVCQYGILPCNGLLYVPPHSCACYIEAKLSGFYALAPLRPGETVEPVPAADNPLEQGPAYESPGLGSTEAAAQAQWPTYRHDAARSGSTKAPVSADLKYTWQTHLGGRLSAPVMAEGKVFLASVDTHTVQALDAQDGRLLWRFMAGGRVDSPPTVHKGLVVFGSADGWVYCLRSSDGKLVWKFRAAPEERRVVAFGQVESAWPVHGSVLIQDDFVYCAAGRSSYIDGGIYLYRLDLKTGRKLAATRLYSRDPKTGEQPEEPRPFEMPGLLPDLLSSDGDLVYMRHLGFDPRSLQQREARSHLYSPAGFLNDAWWHRTYWIYGTHFYSGYLGWYFAGREVPAGRLLVFDGSSIYGFAYQPDFYRGATGRKYHLFATDRQIVQEPPDYQRASRDYPPRGQRKFKVKFRWAEGVPLLARALVLAGQTLFVAGPPERALRSRLAFEGRRGGFLYAISATEGRTLKGYQLDSLPVFDGLIAAEGRLYMCTIDGKLLCLGQKGQPIPEAVAAKRKPQIGAQRQPREPGLVGYWKFDEGKGEIAADSSGMGNDAEVYAPWVKGTFGTCVLIEGIPGAITIFDGPDLHFGTSEFSIEFWVKVDGFGRRIMGKENFPQNWWVINLLEDGRVEMVLGETRAEGKTVRPTSRTPLAAQQWTQVAFVVNREKFEVKCYINGELDSTTRIPPTLKGSLSVEGRDLRIPSTFKPFAGLFDELKIYRRALTDAEVKQSYEREKNNRTSVEFRVVDTLE
ncbi:MAG TPA: methyltransferase domain-containing protein [Armatimonadetes bacterium]|nr:methyltransferase domain-containing protein [Armatimonadota bacterium]